MPKKRSKCSLWYFEIRPDLPKIKEIAANVMEGIQNEGKYLSVLFIRIFVP